MKYYQHKGKICVANFTLFECPISNRDQVHWLKMFECHYSHMVMFIKNTLAKRCIPLIMLVCSNTTALVVAFESINDILLVKSSFIIRFFIDQLISLVRSPESAELNRSVYFVNTFLKINTNSI